MAYCDCPPAALCGGLLALATFSCYAKCWIALCGEFCQNLGEGERFVASISKLWLYLRQNPWWRRRTSWSNFRTLSMCVVSSHWLRLSKNPWWRRRASWSIFRNRSLCVCTALASLWQDNTELLLAVPEYAWFWLDYYHWDKALLWPASVCCRVAYRN